MIIARQSTARTVTVGPILDADGVAVTDGVVGDFKIAKNGGAPAALNGSATLTHRHTGHYSLALTATDLDTVGHVEIVIDDTVNACPAKEIMVVEEAVYDVWYAASATGAVLLQATQTGVTIPTVTTLTNLPSIPAGWLTAAGIASGAITNAKFAAGAIDASAIAANAFASAKFAADYFTSMITAIWTTAATRVLTAATNLTTALATPTNITGGTITTVSGNVAGSVGSVAAGGITAASFAADALARLGIVAFGTAQSATATTLVLASSSAFANDELIGAVLVITGGSAGVGQSRVITDSVLSTDTVTVDTWTTTPSGTITYVIFAAPPASATALPTVLLSPGTGTGQISLTSGKVSPADGSISAATLAADTITAAKVAADVTTEIQSGLATASALSTVAGYLDTEVAAILAAVDTEVAAIKAKTDNLPAAPAATGDIPATSAIADAVLDEVVDGGYTLRQLMRLVVSALGAKVSGAATTTVTFRDVGDSKDRIVATVTADGDRTAVTLDLT